jgi:predicted short-subunit dehydrogenase-like oxidoreductase (DUF2520 family)
LNRIEYLHLRLDQSTLSGMKADNFTLIGPGSVGRTLARAMNGHGYKAISVMGIEPASGRRFAREIGAKWSLFPGQVPPETGLILIAVPDSEIKSVAHALSEQDLPWNKLTILHVSGAVGAEALDELEQLGAGVGACHPFMTFPQYGRHNPPRLPSSGARNVFEGVTFGIDGNEHGLRKARKLVRSLGGKPLVISGQQRVLYHLAAVLSCGMISANLLMAQQVLCSLGISERRALDAILPISVETLRNIKELGIRDSMTGPAVRGDTATIRRHLRELKKLDPGLAKVYNEMSKWVIGKHQR